MYIYGIYNIIFNIHTYILPIMGCSKPGSLDSLYPWDHGFHPHVEQSSGFRLHSIQLPILMMVNNG